MNAGVPGIEGGPDRRPRNPPMRCSSIGRRRQTILEQRHRWDRLRKPWFSKDIEALIAGFFQSLKP